MADLNGVGYFRIKNALEQFDQRNNQRALGNHRRYHPFQQVDFGGFNFGFKVRLDRLNIDLGGQVAVEQLDLLFRKGLGLLFRKAAFGQIFDKSMSIKGDRFIHAMILVRDMTKCNALSQATSCVNRHGAPRGTRTFGPGVGGAWRAARL